jgi:hypothetical protein
MPVENVIKFECDVCAHTLYKKELPPDWVQFDIGSAESWTTVAVCSGCVRKIVERLGNRTEIIVAACRNLDGNKNASRKS